ncbi:MAG TPA: hypothetical protein VHU91_03530, partial [Mycobacteriales bacterium]|nr:hypothetical protein [Mycobacteriales bacterium]
MNKWIKRSLQVSAVAGGIVLAGAAAANADQTTQHAGGNPGVLNSNQASIDDIQVPINVSGNGVGATLVGDAQGLGSGDGSAHAVSKSASGDNWGGDSVSQENGGNPGILNGNQ